MMRKSDITALVARSEDDYKKIENEYNKALYSQDIPSNLKIDIKNLCGNLRSILDYLAHEMKSIHCPSANPKDIFYFPILEDKTDYRSKMSKWYPNLDTTCIDLWDYLESIQPYHQGFEWLGNFNHLNNENKHDQLVEQTRREVTEVRVKTQGGGQIRWNPDGVKFGSGVRIGGVPVDPKTQLPIPHPAQNVEKITWVDFRFDGIDVSAIAMLKATLEGVQQITDKVYKWL